MCGSVAHLSAIRRLIAMHWEETCRLRQPAVAAAAAAAAAVRVVQFEQLLHPLAALLTDALQMRITLPRVASAAPAAKQGKSTSTSGGKALAAAAAAVSPQPVPLDLQLLLDPMLCELPWEALSVVRRSCGSITRCLSLAQLQQLLVPPQTLLLAHQQQQGSAVDAAEPAQPVGWEVGKLSYLVDPLHHMSSTAEWPGCYAAPLLQTFK
jgi:hypothetical protein